MKRLLIVSVLLLSSLNASLSNAYDRVTYIHSNGQGTPVAASDEQGNLEWRAEYYPFGEEFSNTEVRRENDISYSGKPLDQEIGLIYFGARHYDPQIGRFTSIDPAQATAHNYLSFNRYAYANNNPYKYADPNGEFPFLIPAAIFLGKEIAAEIASRATGGATDFLSLRRLGKKLIQRFSAKNPTLQVSRSDMPNIADNIEDAIENGAPSTLNRVTSKSQIRKNRREALRGQESAGPGQSLDEYPFASCAQGGSGSCVKAVPASEQNVQGGKLSQFYKSNNIGDGDAFDVKVVD